MSEATPAARQGEVLADERVLICLEDCHGEFYLPLKEGEAPTCPVVPRHKVAVYKLQYTHRPADEVSE